MVRFRPRTTPTNYLAGREQRRLLVLVLLVGLVYLLMREVRDPRRWQWMWRADVPNHSVELAPAMSDDRPASSGPSSVKIDTRLRPSVPAEAGTIVVASANKHGEPRTNRPFGVRSELLDRVRDDAPFRGPEHETWFHLLDILRATEAPLLAAASTGTVDFAQLFQQSNEYRGEVVTVRGTVRQSLWVAAPENSLGIQGYYQLTVQPLGYQAAPIIIYALALPASFPHGEAISADITATGFYFKRWAYPAQDAIRLAPVVLVASVVWSPPLAPAVRPATRTTWLGAALLATLLAAGSLLLGRRRKVLPTHRTLEPAPDWTKLDAFGEPGSLFAVDQAPSRDEGSP